MHTLKKCVLTLFISGCAAHQPVQQNVSYYYHGRLGAAVEYFGSMERATDALHQAEAECEYELRQITMRQGFPPGPLVYDECLAAKGWVTWIRD